MKPCQTNQTVIMLNEKKMCEFIGNLRCTQCDHYVSFKWSSYDGKMYCQDCWDMNREEEEEERQKEIKSLKERLAELEED